MIASRMLSFSYNFVNSIFVSFPRFVSFFIPVLFLLLLLFLLVLPFNTWNVPETFIEFTRVCTEIYRRGNFRLFRTGALIQLTN